MSGIGGGGMGWGLGVWLCKVGGLVVLWYKAPPPLHSHPISEGYHSVVYSQAPR